MHSYIVNQPASRILCLVVGSLLIPTTGLRADPMGLPKTDVPMVYEYSRNTLYKVDYGHKALEVNGIYYIYLPAGYHAVVFVATANGRAELQISSYDSKTKKWSDAVTDKSDITAERGGRETISTVSTHLLSLIHSWKINSLPAERQQPYTREKGVRIEMIRVK